MVCEKAFAMHRPREGWAGSNLDIKSSIVDCNRQGILEDWPEPLDAKLDFVKRVWDSISTTLCLQDTDFKAVDVLHCTNRQRTRRLLQLLAIAAAKERGLQRHTPRPLLMPPSLPLHSTPAQEPPQCPSPTATSVCWH